MQLKNTYANFATNVTLIKTNSPYLGYLDPYLRAPRFEPQPPTLCGRVYGRGFLPRKMLEGCDNFAAFPSFACKADLG